MYKITFLLVVSLGIALGHVRLRQPPNRSSLWRDPAFKDQHPPVNYDDDGLYCGTVHQWEEDNRCGLCGDPLSEAMPRSNENGGKYGRGIIAGKYSPGQTIPINVEFTTSHLGYFEIHICDQLPESDACFRKLTLGNGNTKWPLNPPERPVWVNTTVQLPSDIRCEQCTLRLHYRGGNNWGDCGNGKEGMGCGLQETFRSCADISVL